MKTYEEFKQETLSKVNEGDYDCYNDFVVDVQNQYDEYCLNYKSEKYMLAGAVMRVGIQSILSDGGLNNATITT